MTSLRRHLLIWLLPLYVLSAAAAMFVSYQGYNTSISAFMDGQMHSLGETYARELAASATVPTLRALDFEHVEHDGAPIVQLWRDGQLLASSWPIPALGLQREAGFHTLSIAGRGWRLYTATATVSPVSVQIAQSNAFRRRVILHSAEYSAVPIAVLVPFSAALLWLAVYFGLRPLARLVQAVTQQDERSLAQLPLTGVPRELRPLLAAVNALLARLRRAFDSQQLFVQDAAHELRTPLMALMLQAEGLRSRFGTTADEELLRLEAGIRRLHRLVEQLLKLARQQAAPPGSPTAAVELLPLLQEVVGDLLPLAEQRNIDVGFRAAVPLSVRGNADALRSVFDNLLDNAVRHTPAGGSVDISLHGSAAAVVVEFADSGPGIAPELLERVFDRFYRPPGTTSTGSGLGLAIARSAAERVGARIELLNRTDSPGLLARVHLPGAA